MKLPMMFWVVLTTLLLLSVVIFASLDFPYPIVFYLTILGQVVLVYMVFRVLKDDYTTTKTFEDFY